MLSITQAQAGMTTPPQFLVRDARATDDDGSFIISSFDAVLPFLESIGSHEQWGLTPFSRRQGWVEETSQQIKNSASYRPTGSDRLDDLRIFIAEMEWPTQGVETIEASQAHSRVSGDGRHFLSVGFAFIRENWLPSYITSQAHLRMGEVDRSDLIYLEVMITDSRVGNLRRGAGAALLRSIREYSQRKGKKVVYLDGWAGNGGNLIKYYEEQGFEAVGDFSIPRASGPSWEGTLMRLNLGEDRLCCSGDFI